MYLYRLKGAIAPLIIHELQIQIDAEANLVLQEDPLHFKQAGALPHYCFLVRQGLNKRFLDKYIGGDGAVECDLGSQQI